jgi:hypothetical protein
MLARNRVVLGCCLAFLLAIGCDGSIDSTGATGKADKADNPAASDPGAPAPPSDAELCNHFDDDGDGEVDEGCPCAPKQTQACFPAPPIAAGAAGVDGADPKLPGACAMGAQTCLAASEAEFGGKWGPCEGAVTPQEEICGDGLDQDCDGSDLPCANPCDTPALESVEDSLPFSNPGGCPWGSGGNLSKKDLYCRARVEQALQLQLPQGALICRMEFSIPGQGMWYDDYMWVTFDDVVLMSAVNFTGMTALKRQGDLVFYDWNAMKGLPYAALSTGPSPFCLGQAKGLGSCTLPPTDSPGSIAFTLDASVVQQLAQVAIAQGRYEVKVVSAGDDDDSDCSHTPFTFKVKTFYVRK